MKTTLVFVALFISFNLNAKYTLCNLEGNSMYPTLESGDALIYYPVDFSTLKEGDICIYTFDGKNICHTCNELTKHGWKMQGDNNRFRDRGFMTVKNYKGKVKYKNGKIFK